ncbi:Hypothetical_protein [Hexamita inflata]|uniref:Hypothetical_protein n=1 Tax=Hexamita inflata TaxID=28002 RepID=A0AA86P181_9EUKA|nr:Hypothetical protein HINF_LOCUS18342 [Hexamita inflata]
MSFPNCEQINAPYKAFKVQGLCQIQDSEQNQQSCQEFQLLPKLIQLYVQIKLQIQSSQQEVDRTSYIESYLNTVSENIRKMKGNQKLLVKNILTMRIRQINEELGQ